MRVLRSAVRRCWRSSRSSPARRPPRLRPSRRRRPHRRQHPLPRRKRCRSPTSRRPLEPTSSRRRPELPAGKTVDLTWGTVTGGWVVEDYYHFRGKKYAGRDDLARQVHGRRERSARRAIHDPRRLRRRSRSHRAHRRQAGRAERHRGHAELRADSGFRPRGHADRAQGQGARLADDGEHVGGELGQQPRRDSSRRPARRDRPSRGSARPDRRAITWSGCSPAIRVRVI